MASVTLNTIPVVEGRLTVPWSGLWHADLLLAHPPPVPTLGPQTLLVGTATWVCAIIREATYAGQRRVRVVGGAGGWQSTVPAKQYGGGPPVQTLAVVTDAALAAKELPPVLGPTAPLTLGSAYARANGAASRVLWDIFGANWYLDPSGVIQATVRLAVPVVRPFDVTAVDGSTGIYEIATDHQEEWAPGSTFSNPVASGTVSRVTHVFRRGKSRLEVMVP
jgi:hypothetical protein